MSEAQDIIARCTRNGVTSWQNVAAQMGRSLDSVRAEFDPTYLHARPWPHPCDPVEPEVDVEDTSSPFPKGQGMKARILALLERQSMSAEQLSGFLQSPVNSVRARLDRLLEAGKVCHDGAFPRTWGLIEANGRPRQYASASVPGPGFVGGFNQDVDRRTTLKMAANIVTAGRRRSRAGE